MSLNYFSHFCVKYCGINYFGLKILWKGLAREPIFDGKDGQADTGFQIQFFAKLVTIAFYGSGTAAHSICNFLVAELCYRVFQEFFFPFGNLYGNFRFLIFIEIGENDF